MEKRERESELGGGNSTSCLHYRGKMRSVKNGTGYSGKRTWTRSGRHGCPLPSGPLSAAVMLRWEGDGIKCTPSAWEQKIQRGRENWGSRDERWKWCLLLRECYVMVEVVAVVVGTHHLLTHVEMWEGAFARTDLMSERKHCYVYDFHYQNPIFDGLVKIRFSFQIY